jgi:hypothetical protein
MIASVAAGNSLRTNLRRNLSRMKWRAWFAGQALRGTPVRTGEVDLDALLVGEQCGTPLERWVEATGEWSRASCLLAESPYVQLLRSVQECERSIADDEFLNAQPYHRMAQTAIECTGSYFGAKTSAGIRQQMRAFWERYSSLRDGRRSLIRCDDYRHSAQGDLVWTHKIRDSACYEISDGHHRAAMFYMLERSRIPTLILGEKYSYLQTLVGCTNEEDLEVSQPVDKEDVRGWSVRRQCRDRLELAVSFLRRQGWQGQTRTALDASCGYGWFVHQLGQLGMDAVGVTPVDADVKVGRVAFGLTAGSLRRQGSGDALRGAADQPHDMVLFLSALQDHVLGLRDEDEHDILRLLDRATGRVLILDTAHNHESRYRAALPEWNDQHIRACVLANTTFKRVIALGRDRDGRGKHEGQYGRTLFACIR